MKSHSRGIAPAKASVYRDIFVQHIHDLLWMGYSRLKHTVLSKEDEPAISGMICENIESVLDDASSPDWVDNYEIHDDPPVHTPKRQGKHRRRVDIRLDSRRARPRIRFCFEAKILKKTIGVAKYLGDDGLGRFIDGSYSSDAQVGGMIAYVQDDDCTKWASKVNAKLDTKTHKLGRGGKWAPVVITSDLRHTYQTKHKRPKQLVNITIIHTLLDCTG